MKNHIYSILLLSLLIVSCKDTQAIEKAEIDALFAEVMEIHDAVMPETNTLFKLKRQADINLKLLPDTSKYVKMLIDTKIDADKADEVMMIWMEKFKIPDATHEEKMVYLNAEKISIAYVRDVMLKSIKECTNTVNASTQHIEQNNLQSK